MSEDDRMDRARRIREMREGTDDRSADDSGDDADTPPGGDPGANEDPTADDDAAGNESGDDTSGENDGDAVEMEWGAPGGSDTADDAASEEGAPDPGDGIVEEESDDGEMAGDDGASAEDTDETGSDIRAPLPGADELEEALDEQAADAGAETVTPDVTDEAEESQETTEQTRVLEFTLHDEHYCLDIDYIEEIVKEETITRVPNTPAFVEGVVDLRGQITTILNPKVTIDKPDTAAGELIVVFDSDAFEDQGHVGWVVDDVRQVSLISEGEVNDPPIEDEHINGVIDRDDETEFVIWTSPELVFTEAAG